MASTLTEDLLAFLQASPTPFHATQNVASELLAAGFEALNERESWQLTRPGKYFVTRNDSSIIAFQLGAEAIAERGARIIGAHTDSPCLKPKPYADVHHQHYAQWGVEVYGGVLLNPWFDRDLSLAGKVSFTMGAGQVHHTLVDFNRPIAIIPSLAIHLDRDANSKRTINAQTDIPPITARAPQQLPDLLREQVIASLSLEEDAQAKDINILAWDLSFYDTQAPSTIGLLDEFICSARLDNLLSCFLALRALLQADTGADQWIVLNDHEEVGSTSFAGADGTMLQDILMRVYPDEQDRLRTMAHSMLISTDNAHGVHPNYPSKHDAKHGPILNDGPVIKINANQRYATSSDSDAWFAHLCQTHDIPYQKFVTRSDMGCGSTIGPITAAKLGIQTIDVGAPTFAMHSIRETAGTEDAAHLLSALTHFLSLKQAPVSHAMMQ